MKATNRSNPAHQRHTFFCATLWDDRTSWRIARADSRKYWKDIEPLDWRGNDLDKTKALTHTFVTTFQNNFPKIAGYRYDFNTKRFLDNDGRPVSRERFLSGAKSDIGSGTRAGQGSLRRGVLIQSLASSTSSERPGILESVINGSSQLLNGGDLDAAFSRAAVNQPAAPSGTLPDETKAEAAQRNSSSRRETLGFEISFAATTRILSSFMFAVLYAEWQQRRKSLLR